MPLNPHAGPISPALQRRPSWAAPPPPPGEQPTRQHAAIKSGTPIYQALTAWTKRLATLRQHGVSDQTLQQKIAPVIHYDLARVQKGSNPISNDEAWQFAAQQLGSKTKEGAAIAKLGQAPAHGGFLSDLGSGNIGGAVSDLGGAVTRDVQSFAESIPSIPGAMWHQLRGVYAIGSEMNKEAGLGTFSFLGKPDAQMTARLQQISKEGGLQQMRDLAAMPGNQLLPGAYTLHNVLSGQEAAQVQQHPVFAALDVLPFVAGAAKGAFAGTEAAQVEGSAAEAGAAGNVPKMLFRAAGGSINIDEENLARLSEATKIKAVQYIADHADDPTAVMKAPRTSEYARKAAEALGTDATTRNELLAPMQVAMRRIYGEGQKTLQTVTDKVGQLGPEDNAALLRAEQAGTSEGLSPELAVAYQTARDIGRTTQNQMLDAGDLIQLHMTDYTGREIQGATYLSDSKMGRVLWRERTLEAKLADHENGSAPLTDRALTKAQNDLGAVREEIGRRVQGITAGGRKTIADAPRAFWPMVHQRAEEYIREDLQRVQAGGVSRFKSVLKGNVTPDAYADLLDNYAGPDFFDQLKNQVFNGDAGLAHKYKNMWISTASREWSDWALDLGRDPLYLPHVSENQMVSMFRQPLADRGASASVLKKADIYNVDPGIGNVSQLLTYQEVEGLLRPKVQEELLSHTIQTWGVSETQARDLEQAAHGTLRKTARALRQNWVPFSDTAGKYVGGRKLNTIMPGDKTMIPKRVADTVDKSLRDFNDTSLGLFRKGTNFYRFAVTTTPRHLVHVASSGMMFTLGERGVRDFPYMPTGWKMARDGQTPYEIGQPFFGGMTNDELLMHGDGWVMGKTVADHLPLVGKIKTGALWVKHFEESVANMYKNATMLSEEHRLNVKGVNPDVAHAAAVQEALRIHFNVDNMSLPERFLTRNIIPFYPFTRQILRYMLRYPADHPLRASFISNLTRSENEVQRSGLPLMYNNYFAVGGLDPATGLTPVSDLKTFNPFRSIGNQQSPLSLSGWLSGLNPAFAAPLNYIGVDTLSGRIKLNGGTQVDPYTGVRESTTFGSLFGDTLTQYFPQSQILLGWINFKQQLQKLDSPAQRHAMFDTLGIPFVPFNVNLRNERLTLENNYYQAAKGQISEAFYNGDYTSSQYPYVPYEGGWATPAQIQQQRAGYASKYGAANPSEYIPTSGGVVNP